MTKKCIYCGSEIASENLIDFCDQCGIRSFGSKMYRAILENVKQANVRGDLQQNNIN